ncbi:MAG: transglycosylase domain-containing protein, partial [Smithellaceae bacterium]
LIRRYILLFLAVGFLLAAASHLGYMYFQVGREVAEKAGEAPAIFYGSPTYIRKGDHLENLHFTERLQRLSYRRIQGKPTEAGTYSIARDSIRIYPRNIGSEKKSFPDGPVKIVVQTDRVVSLLAPDGSQLNSICLEPEEIGRILGPQMESRRPVTLDAVSPYLQKAVVASEDARFYSHMGIDFLAIGRALLINLKERRFAQGASTITQQLARNFFLSPQKTLGRKLREMEMALVLEMRYSKPQILEMYLNKIYFGQEGLRGIYGIEEAAGFYFSKPAKDLSLEESALLAGIIRSPRKYANIRDSQAALKRRNNVLARMRKLNMIQEAEYQQASRQPVRLQQRKIPVRLSSYFVDYIQRITAEELGGEKLYRTGYRYHTTLDPIQQAAAEEAVGRGIAEIERTALPAGEPLQAALVAVNPKTGAMTAMVGGRSYEQSHFNRAVDAKRQPGSAFKPFVLLAALVQSVQGKANKTLSTLVSGEPISLPTPEGIWTPVNFEGKTYDKITIRKIIEDSVNTAAVRLAYDVGFQEVLNTARAAGITSPLLPVPSIALGSFEVTPLELAYAFATLASGGIRFERYPLYAVNTASEDPLIVRTVQQQQVFDSRATYLTGYAMEGVLARGTAKESKALGINFPAAGKTGTTNSNRDSWFVGYTPDVVCVVWVGYDSGADTGLTGAKGALRIWTRFMRTLYARSAPSAVIVPQGIETALIDPESGLLATNECPQKLREAYLSGTAPKETCPLHPENAVGKTIRNGIQGVREFFRNLFK